MNTTNNFSGQVAVVTGSANGIGKSIAENLYEKGAYVVISDIEITKGEEVARKLGERAIFIPCDISDPTQVDRLISVTVQHFEKLDIMVNNAGVNGISSEDRVTIDQYPDQTWHKLIDIDLNGTYYCCKAAAKVMIAQKSGSIINIASVAGVVALRLQIGFVAAKAAVIKMTEAMACELGPMGIRINSVSPGSILTNTTERLFYNKEGTVRDKPPGILSFIPQRRPGGVKEVAEAVLFLASQSSSYINGHNLIVDGGWVSGFNRDF